MRYSYKTSGTCAQEIHFDIEDGMIKELEFVGGCNGNLKAISTLVKGQDVDHIVNLLQGLTCGYKNTSCADQLTKALLATKK